AEEEPRQVATAGAAGRALIDPTVQEHRGEAQNGGGQAPPLVRGIDEQGSGPLAVRVSPIANAPRASAGLRWVISGRGVRPVPRGNARSAGGRTRCVPSALLPARGLSCPDLQAGGSGGVAWPARPALGLLGGPSPSARAAPVRGR